MAWKHKQFKGGWGTHQEQKEGVKHTRSNRERDALKTALIAESCKACDGVGWKPYPDEYNLESCYLCGGSGAAREAKSASDITSETVGRGAHRSDLHYMTLRPSVSVHHTEEAEAGLLVDLDDRGRILGVEKLGSEITLGDLRKILAECTYEISRGISL